MQPGVLPRRNCLTRPGNILKPAYLGCLLLFGAWFSATGKVEPEAPLFQRYTGLSTSNITRLFQDEKGFLWVGTLHCLERFDGYQFQTVCDDPNDPSALSDARITAIHQDRHGYFWIGTNKGLNYMDGQMRRLPLPERQINPSEEWLNQDQITAIYEDQNGVLWVGTGSGNLIRLDPQNKTLSHFSNGGEEEAMRINQITQDEKGVLWLATAHKGLFRFDPDTSSFQQLAHPQGDTSGLKHNRIQAILLDGPTLWVASLAGLEKVDRVKETYEFTAVNPNGARESHFGSALSLLKIRDVLYIGTGSGLKRLNLTNGKIDSFTIDGSQRQVGNLLLDRAGLLWIGTDNGLYSFAPNQEFFNIYRHHPGLAGGLSHNHVSYFLENPIFLWVATHGGGLNQVNKKTGEHQVFLHQSQDPDSLSNNNVTSLVTDARGRLWVGTHDGLNRMDTKGRFRRFLYEDQGISQKISTLALTEHGLWVGSRDGLTLIDPDSGKNLSRFTTRDGLCHNTVWIIYPDSDGTLWLGTLLGLSHFDPSTRTFVNYVHDPKDPFSLANDRIGPICRSRNGTLWIGTEAGLCRLNADTDPGSFSRFDTRNGLASDIVEALLEDQNGILWISSNAGLTRFDPQKLEAITFTAVDGLQSNEFSSCSALAASDGTLFFGGVNGFNSFRPDAPTWNQKPAPPVLTGLRIDNLEQIPVFEESTPLVLKPQNRLIRFEVIAPDFLDPKANRFAFQLVGRDSDWGPAQDRPNHSYADLPPGDYTFKVKAANSYGLWSNDFLQIPIRVLAPPSLFLSFWAFCFYGLVLLAGIVFIFLSQRYKLNSERGLNRQLAHLNKLKDEFLANTSHELRTPLNGIMGLADSLVSNSTQVLPSTVSENLKLIKSSAKRLASLVNDLLDFATLRHGNLSLKLEPVNLHALVEVVFAISRPMIKGRDLILINQVPPDLPDLAANEDRLEQIMHNLIGNAIKFTDSGSVVVTAVQDKAIARIRIIDTGPGIPADKLEQIFQLFEQLDGSSSRRHGGTGLGLAISRELAQLQKGELYASSQAGQGSEFHLNLPLYDGQESIRVQPLLALPQIEVEPQPEEIAVTRVDGKGYHLLLVDDEPVNRKVIANYLDFSTYTVTETADGPQALVMLNGPHTFDLILLDIMMPQMSGYEVCAQIRERWSANELPVIFLTARNREKDVATGFEVGGNDYLIKPISRMELLARVQTQLKLVDAHRTLQAEKQYLQEEVQLEHRFGNIIFKSEIMKKLLQKVERSAPTQATVLIQGETGTGKELLAHAIHRLSKRAQNNLVRVNCATLPANLIESELFGHERGAFTGAIARKIGRFELADGGTLFLDEIGELPLELQSKLLRALQEGEIQRLGAATTRMVNVRVIAATNIDLEKAVAAGTFREDLFFRLNVLPLRSPCLRERREDIPLLVHHFMEKYAADLGREAMTVSQKTMDRLVNYSWPGNIRELQNIIERTMILGKEHSLDLDDWRPVEDRPSDHPIQTMEELERAHIIKVLELKDWRVRGPKGAAMMLDIKPTTLEARMKKLNIQRS